MSHPVMLYRHPGPHDIHGDKFDYKIVELDDVDAHVEAGWFKTTPEAKEHSGNKLLSVVEPEPSVVEPEKEPEPSVVEPEKEPEDVVD